MEAARQPDEPKKGVEAAREPNFLLAKVEKRALRAIAARLPRWILPDDLTALGVLSAIGVRELVRGADPHRGEDAERGEVVGEDAPRQPRRDPPQSALLDLGEQEVRLTRGLDAGLRLHDEDLPGPMTNVTTPT